jgi:hypothetical protein
MKSVCICGFLFIKLTFARDSMSELSPTTKHENIIFLAFCLENGDWGLVIGDWGLGTWDWGLGKKLVYVNRTLTNTQSPIPNR